MARCVQDDGVVVNYGSLSGEACRVDVRETVFRNVGLRGFWLCRWFMVTPPQTIATTYRMLAAKLADGTLMLDGVAIPDAGRNLCTARTTRIAAHAAWARRLLA